MVYTIKQVTTKFNIPASTLRYYEKEGLLPVIEKNGSGQRIYHDSDLEWLNIINCMRKTGMKISYIKKYIDLCNQGDETLLKRYQIFLEQKKIIEAHMLELEENMKTVNHKIEKYQKELKKHPEISMEEH